MIANGKIRITITSNQFERDFFIADDLLYEQRVLLADAVVSSIEHSNVSVLELRIIVPSQSAEQLLVGLVKGETEIAIGQISKMAEPD